MGPEFLHTIRKFCVLRSSLPDVAHAWRSANGTQPNFAKRKEVNGADASQIRWRRVVNVNATIEIGSLVSRGPKNLLKLAMASRRAAFSGNTSLIATYFSFIINTSVYIDYCKY